MEHRDIRWDAFTVCGLKTKRGYLDCSIRARSPKGGLGLHAAESYALQILSRKAHPTLPMTPATIPVTGFHTMSKTLQDSLRCLAIR
jgi:hypothetical protein